MKKNLNHENIGDTTNTAVNEDGVIIAGGGTFIVYWQLKNVQFGSGELTAKAQANSPSNAGASELKVLCLPGQNTPADLAKIISDGTNFLSGKYVGSPSFTETSISFKGRQQGAYYTVHAAVRWSDGNTEKLGSYSDKTF